MEQQSVNSMPDFKDLVYERPDIEAFRKTVRDIRLKLMTATDPEFAADTLFEYEREISRIDTAYALCNIKHDLNTKDEFFVKELEFSMRLLRLYPNFRQQSCRYCLPVPVRMP